VLGVISGIGMIAGASWAPHLQRVLRWILFALLAVSALAVVGIILTVVLDVAG
jgi:hypothetical protein